MPRTGDQRAFQSAIKIQQSAIRSAYDRQAPTLSERDLHRQLNAARAAASEEGIANADITCGR
jgi:hypothetical protein